MRRRSTSRGGSPRAPYLTFAGLQAYHGSAQHLRGWEERRQAIAQAAERAGRTRDLLARHGIECPTITGAGNRHLRVRIGERRLYELQCGSYIFMDADYRPQPRPRRRPDQGLRAEPFRVATVMSRPTRTAPIVDAGLKALAFDSGPPLVWDEPPPPTSAPPDEHAGSANLGRHNRLRSRQDLGRHPTTSRRRLTYGRNGLGIEAGSCRRFGGGCGARDAERPCSSEARFVGGGGLVPDQRRAGIEGERLEAGVGRWRGPRGAAHHRRPHEKARLKALVGAPVASRLRP